MDEAREAPDRVRELIERVARQRAAEREARAVLAARRVVGLQRRHAEKLGRERG